MAYARGETESEWRKGNVSRVVCDPCANAGEVEFETRTIKRFTGEVITDRFQVRPWRWFPLYGAPCDKCCNQC